MRRVIEILYNFKEYLVLVFLSSLSLVLFAKSETAAMRSFRSFAIEVSGVTESMFSGLSRYTSLFSENNGLYVQNMRLSEQVNFLRAAKAENVTLHTLLQFKASSDYILKTATVVDKSISLDRNLIMINLGSVDSIKQDMVTVTDHGLAGRVILTSRNYSIVQPIINKDFRVSVIDEASRDFGILEWNGESYKEADILNIPLTSKIQKGDRIVTSEYSSFAPAGLEVGHVSSMITAGSFYKVKVLLSVDFESLEIMFVQTREKNLERDDLKKRYKDFQ